MIGVCGFREKTDRHTDRGIISIIILTEEQLTINVFYNVSHTTAFNNKYNTHIHTYTKLIEEIAKIVLE